MKRLFGFIFLALSLFSLASCGNPNEATGTTYTDLLGREVVIDKKPERVVCIGSGALRLYSYIGDMNLLCGAEDIELNMTGTGNGRPLRTYKMVHKDFLKTLPSCGNGGNAPEADSEKILSCNPDIVISRIMDRRLMDKLSNEIGKPVVVISYGDKQAFDPKIKESIKLIGKIFEREERANHLVSYMNSIEAELTNLTKDIADADKESLYLGCYTNHGAHGMESSTAQYPLFDVSNIKNVLDSNGFTGVQANIDFEKLLTMNPDKVIIDVAGLKLLENQYKEDKNAEIFNAMDAFKNGEVYVQLPYNGYYTNLELAFCDAYFIASVAYPNLFKATNLEAKFREILVEFVGVDVYDDIITEVGMKPGKLDLALTFPKYSK